MLTLPVAIDRQKLVGVSGPVVKQADFVALTEAKAIVVEAVRYSEALKSNMREQVEAAYASGYAAGMQQGREDFGATVVQTVAEMQTTFSRLEARIVSTVMGALEEVLGRLDPRAVMEQLVHRVLAQARDRKQLRLRVAAEQYDAVSERLDRVLKSFPDVEFIEVFKDPQAAVGTCVLESEFGAIDASLDVQLASVRRGLMSAFAERRGAAAATRD